MKRTNLFKTLATILAVAMVLAMVPMAVMAANTATADIEYDYTNNKAVVKGSIDSGAELTMIVVRTTEEITTLDYFTSDEDLENAIMYIDQITSDGTEKTWSFALRDTAEGNILTAFVGGTDAAVADDSVKILAAAPAIAPEAAEYFSDEDIVFTVTGADGWAAGVTEVKVNGEVDSNAVVTDSSITINATADVTSIEAINADYATAKWNGTVTVKDRYTEAAKAVKAATIVYEEDGVTATITVPADETDAVTGADIAYTVTVDGEDTTADADGKVVVTRKEDNGDDVNDAIEVVITATITKDGAALGDAKTQTINVKEQGTNGPSVDAANVAFAGFDGEAWVDAYGIDGANIIEIAKGELDPSKDGLKLGEAVFFYSPVREKYIGVVAGYASAEDVVAAIEVTEEAPVNVFYGTVDDPTHEYWVEGDGVVLADVMAALRMKNGQTADLGLEYFISADVDQDGEILLSDVMMILKAKNTGVDSFEIEEN